MPFGRSTVENICEFIILCSYSCHFSVFGFRSYSFNFSELFSYAATFFCRNKFCISILWKGTVGGQGSAKRRRNRSLRTFWHEHLSMKMAVTITTHLSSRPRRWLSLGKWRGLDCLVRDVAKTDAAERQFTPNQASNTARMFMLFSVKSLSRALFIAENVQDANSEPRTRST